jgi:hypothetical protein
MKDHPGKSLPGMMDENALLDYGLGPVVCPGVSEYPEVLVLTVVLPLGEVCVSELEVPKMESPTLDGVVIPVPGP